MNHRIALLSAAIAIPLALGAGNAQAAPVVSPEPAAPVADSGSALLNSDLAVLLGTGSGQLARLLVDTGSSRTPSNAEIAASGSYDLATTGSALGNDLLTTGSAQALIGPGSAWSNFWVMLGNSGSGKGWMQGFGSSGYQNG
ncbi:hypothetical protein LTV02_35845 [Nocardia yamanashiensis]|uniref:hypothetical protein n=1 Tax=Nocardia yamanashiensis TaxID=209247 RepID=UPI001E2BDF04|nr:hypothetical protein [Nocardia yamanashiensis]UGT41255.1 hypothetical protein LTV02_35845 [Nocardia yamanashiensis]